MQHIFIMESLDINSPDKIVGQNTFFKFEMDVSKIFTVKDWDTIEDFNTLENRVALATQILQGNVKVNPVICYGEEFHEDYIEE